MRDTGLEVIKEAGYRTCVASIYGGTNEIQKNIIAKAVLGL